ncbi:BMP family lipoprotein [Sediminibacillus albus]|uniref:BMP family lipoprotein n=1 Tax=Sediminibacillus albus TaxID=407036 RepID=UPI000B8A0924|nr:BMP family ABC transporter substrate-binding protein [Sediminibacillus albus]
MKKITVLVLLLMMYVSGCSQQEATGEEDSVTRIGIMLSDVGLGDQSFSDAAFTGLAKARDELGVVFDYREVDESGSYEEGLQELVEQENDVIIGLGYMVQEDLEKVAKENPDQKFVLIDSVSELSNVTSVTFKADQGSYLAGIMAAITTDNNKIGFIGGDDTQIINDFAQGYEQGAKSVNPELDIQVEYAGDFGDDKLGEEIAEEMADNEVDVIFAAAGFTGVGALKAAQKQNIFAIGVDSDQYFYAEKAVITSVMKKVDIAVFDLAQSLVEKGEIETGHIELGIDNNGVGLAPVRIIELSDQEKQLIEKAKQNFSQDS